MGAVKEDFQRRHNNFVLQDAWIKTATVYTSTYVFGSDIILLLVTHAKIHRLVAQIAVLFKVAIGPL